MSVGNNSTSNSVTVGNSSSTNSVAAGASGTGILVQCVCHLRNLND